MVSPHSSPSRQLKEYLNHKNCCNYLEYNNISFPSFLRRGGQTTKSSDLQKLNLSGQGGWFNFFLLFLFLWNRHLFSWKSLKPLRTYLRNNSISDESVFNHPGRESIIVNISKSAIPATPPYKRRGNFRLQPP